MTVPGDWEQWSERWRAEGQSDAQRGDMIRKVACARGSLVLVRVTWLGVVCVALGIIGLALQHAGNPFEAALGLVVALGIAGVWLGDRRMARQSRESDYAGVGQWTELRRALCARQLRFARLGWMVVLLDLVFLVPWWIGGVRVHGFGFHVAQLVSIWTPLALMAGFVGFTVRLRRRALAERAALSRLGDS